ncbi:alpha/beta hydrolase [Neobacillus sp. D3-1R]|uniref:alpha/beta hydrolase n=1 Tax=Neobacillus sp. D3-1R TaxID=3445778 RepID=UPI003FA08E7B
MIGCLCIHGFTGAPYEVAPLADYLEKKTDWMIRVPTLPGHGEVLQLKGITYQKWLEHAEYELQGLLDNCEQVYCIGFSMGGLIASYLATKYKIDKLVLLSAAAYYINFKQLTEDMKEMVKDTLRGEINQNELFLRYKKKITATPIGATIQFRKLVTEVRRILPEVTIPTFIAQGESDGIVPMKSAQFLFETIGASKKELLYIPKSKHHICHCDENEKLFEEILAFLQSDALEENNRVKVN